MKYITPEISWHNRDPLYSVDLQCGSASLRRLATCGTDRVVRVCSVAAAAIVIDIVIVVICSSCLLFFADICCRKEWKFCMW